MYQEFFWDFDGTLYNTYPGMVEAFMDVFEQKGVKLDQDEVYRHMRQTSLGKTFAYYRTQNDLEEEPEALREEYNPIEAKLEDKMKPFDGFKKCWPRSLRMAAITTWWLTGIRARWKC